VTTFGLLILLWFGELVGTNIHLQEDTMFLVMDYMTRGTINQYLARSEVSKLARYRLVGLGLVLRPVTSRAVFPDL
jgi:hypothetical protein